MADAVASDQTRSPNDWRRVFARLDAALELDETALAPWLAALEATDPDDAAAIRDLLARRVVADADRFLSKAANAYAPGRTPPPSVPADATLVGPYRLVREIGRGGTATVWLAERADGLIERPVALKLPDVSWARGSAFAERMARERTILASLNHPNIARLYDAGIEPNGRPYLALEYVDGEAIDVHAREHALSIRKRAGLLAEVARALAHAHGQLVVHRDLKPSNILVDQQGRPHLLDFGIAKIIQPLPSTRESQQETVVAARALTPDYASPEQWRGESIGIASDVYSLGVVAFELFTGMRPYRLPDLATARGDPFADIVIPRTSELVGDPVMRRQLGGDLDAIVARMLALEPERRYPTMNALAEDLHRHLDGEPVLARVPSRWYVASRWVRRHKVETGITLVLALALAGGAYAQFAVAIALLVGSLLALWQRQRALAEASKAKMALARGDQVKAFIASIFTQAVPRAGSGGVVAATDLLKSAARRVETDLADQPAVAAELGALIGKSFNELGDFDAALAWLPRATDLCMRELGPTHALSLQTRRSWVEAANTVGELAVSERLLPALVADLRGAVPPQTDLLVSTLQGHAFVHTKRGRENAALETLREAVDLAVAHVGEANDLTLSARASWSNTFSHFGRPRDALAAIEPALQAAYALHGEARPHPMLASIERCYGDALSQNDCPRDATAILRTSLDDQRRLDVDDTLRVRITMALLAKTLLARGHFHEAKRLFIESAAINERLTGGRNHEQHGNHRQVATAAAYLGEVGVTRAALVELDTLATSFEQGSLQAAHRQILEAWLACLDGRFDDALLTLAPLVSAADAVPVTTLRAVRLKSWALRRLGSIDEARTCADAVLANIDDGRGLDHGLLDVEVARCVLASGDRTRAAFHWRRALARWEAGQVDGPELLDPLMREFVALQAV